MIVGNPKTKITKTDVARWLNTESARFPELVPLWEKYMDKCSRARRDKVSQFGFWLRTNKPKEFERIFKWSQKHPEILDELYAESTTT
jgi:hypothetical protein